MGKGFVSVCLFLAVHAVGFATAVRAEGDKVYVNEMVVLSLHAGNAAHIANRAHAIAESLARFADSDLQVVESDSGVRIAADDKTVVTVDEDEARAQNQTPDSLAGTWLTNIKTALRLPAIQFAKPSARVPVGGKAQVQTLGSEVDASVLENSNPTVVAAFHKHDTLYIRGVSLGTSTVTLRSKDAEVRLEVEVQPYAAIFPQTLQVMVTGDPASAETVSGAVEGALRTKLPCKPGTQLSFNLPETGGVPMEGSATFTTTVQASSENAFPAEGKVTVVVRNVPLGRRDEADLWYSNNPEDVKISGLLYAAKLATDDPARLLYHHMNASDYPLAFEARVLNPSDKPAEIQIIPGDSPPNLNPVLAGFNAGDQFLRNWVSYSGEIVTIPPRSQLPISVRHANPKQTISGLTYLRLLPGGPDSLVVRMDAIETGVVAEDAEGFKSSMPWHVLGCQKLNQEDAQVPLSTEVYPKPFQVQDLTYKVGGKFGFAEIGLKPIASENSHNKLDGNFGVLYTIHLNLTNPTAIGADVAVVFQSNAGYTGGLFILDGKLIRTHLLQPKEQAEIDRVHLEPGESKPVTILTCPLSGGSYPVTIAVMPQDPTMAMGLAPK
jgi:hypothetical protein